MSRTSQCCKTHNFSFLTVNADHIMMNTNSNYKVRTIRPDEIKETYEMIDKEGWNLTLDKFSTLYESSPGIFYVAVTEDDEVVGTMSLYPTFPAEFVLGNIVIKVGHRYKGLGRKIMDEVFAQHPGAVISLTAVPGADQFYLNTGFILTEPQQSHDIFHLVLDREDLDKRSHEMSHHDIITSLYDECSFDDLVAYDSEARGYQQSSYIAMQIRCFKVVTAKNSSDHIIGYGVAFVKRDEIVLDGLYADSDVIALHLIIEILKHFPGRNTMKIQIPSSQLFLSSLGQAKSAYRYNRYSIGSPTLSPLYKVYNVGDCDYTY